MDWGYSTDYTAVVRVMVKKKLKEIWCEQVLWQKNKTNPELDVALSRLISKDSILICDSSEPKSIEEFRRMGWRKIQGVKKGAGSIKRGIEIMQRYKIYVKSSSQDLVEEFENYKWLINKNGDVTDNPSDDYNHGIDSIRYVALTFLGVQGAGRIFVR